MNTIYMMVGIQGSGKSTLSEELRKIKNIPIVSSDRIRSEMPFLPEEQVFPEVYKRISNNIKSSLDCIYDATSISVGARHNLFVQLENNGVMQNMYKVICIYFYPDVVRSKERVERRNKDKTERYLPLEVIDTYASTIVEPTLDEGFSSIVYVKSTDNLIEVAKKME